MAWKVKKLMPMGRRIFGTGRDRPVIRFRFSIMKPLYLKTTSRAMSIIMPRATKSLARPAGAVFSMSMPIAQLRTELKRSSITHRGSPQA